MGTQPEKSPPEQRRRSICGNCDRPLPVCLCHVIPAPPIPTATQIIIIQHPHESHHKLSTTPLLTKSLLNATAVVSRRLNLNLHPLLSDSSTTFYLFPPAPSSPAVTLSEVKNSVNKLPTAGSPPVVLIAFDATWKHAKEMVKSSEEYLNRFATRVCLDGFDEDREGGSIYDSELILRKEPCGGCVSTLEAVARWLGAVEEKGPEIEGTLIGLLKETVRLQAQFLKPMRRRPKMLKKGRISAKTSVEPQHQNTEPLDGLTYSSDFSPLFSLDHSANGNTQLSTSGQPNLMVDDNGLTCFSPVQSKKKNGDSNT